jgi:mono/diheme cytochrome c family protein
MNWSNRNKRLAAAALFSMVISACGGQPNQPTEEQPAADARAPLSGLRIAQAHSAACHSIGTTGSSPHSEALEFRKFSQYYPVRELEEALAEGIYVGHPDMPVFRFEPDEVEALIDYIQSIQDPIET